MRRLVLLLALVGLLTACAGGGEPAAGPTVTAAPAAPDTPTQAGDPVSPDASVPSADVPAPSASPPAGDDGATAPWDGAVATVDGGSLAGADLVRQDVALWFWAPW